jgi:transcriptional regulator with XRE-family HTH domain
MQDGLLDWTDVRAHFEHVMYSELALTQTEVATRGGIPQEYVSRVLLNHKDGPKAQTLIRAIQGLGIPLAQFFAGLDAAAASWASSASTPVSSAPMPRDEELSSDAPSASPLPAPSVTEPVRLPIGDGQNAVINQQLLDATVTAAVEAAFDRIFAGLDTLRRGAAGALDRDAPATRAPRPAADSRRRRRAR